MRHHPKCPQPPPERRPSQALGGWTITTCPTCGATALTKTHGHTQEAT